MNVIVNGSPHTLAPDANLADLLNAMSLTGKRIAVECNGEIVPRSRHASHTLVEGDRLEIVVAVGGG